MYKIHDYIKENNKIQKIKKTISFVLYMIIIPILFINFTLIIKSFINPNKIPSFLGYKNFIIVSESMEPTIMVGDAIFIKQVNENEIKINDIISFHDGKDINTHRIIGIYEENNIKYYRTKGDNNKNEDKQKITYNQIEGKYQFKISNFGFVLNILKSKITLFILLFIVFFDIYFTYRIKQKKINRKQKRKQYEQLNSNL